MLRKDKFENGVRPIKEKYFLLTLPFSCWLFKMFFSFGKETILTIND